MFKMSKNVRVLIVDETQNETERLIGFLNLNFDRGRTNGRKKKKQNEAEKKYTNSVWVTPCSKDVPNKWYT